MPSHIEDDIEFSGDGAFPDENFDEFLEFGDSMTLGDEGLDNAAWNLQDTPQYNGDLYATPLSWDPPKSQYESEQEKMRPIYTSGLNTLSLAQQEKLRNIAMPDNIPYRSQYSPQSASSTRTYKSSIPSPGAQDKSRKRKSSASADDEDDDEEAKDGQPPPVKKTAHNMIEKRYRTNLNDKIAALRDSVPSLRAMRKNAKGEPEKEAKEDLHGLTPAHKLNKATVLSKATEYIRHLEKRNSRLSDENAAMKARISAFECLFMSGSMGFNPVTPANSNPYTQEQYMTAPNGTEANPGLRPEGMIEVPEDIKRLHAANQLNQQTYAVPQENYQPVGRPVTGSNGWQNGGRFFGKMMVGSLAGLMILEGFGETEAEGTEPNGRGLFAVPTNLLAQFGRSLNHSMDFSVLGYHYSGSQTLSLFRMMLVFGILIYVFIPSFFASRLRATNPKLQASSLAAAPSPASPIQVRQQAWLTATQTIWVPRHNFFLEAAALCWKMLKLSLRNAIGWYGYSLLTGSSEQQEAARVKAWSIALDAQLAGGDIRINKSRLILTLIASGTIPDTPALLMLKAVHVRILLWEFGRAGFNRVFMFQEFAAKLARWKWNEAKQLQELINHTSGLSDGHEVEQLPSHLSVLLENDCDEVLNDIVAQRAYNLAFYLPTSHNATSPSDGMNDVVNDFAIRSPLDAAAAWFSSLVLQRALAVSLNGENSAFDSVLTDVNVALKTAPIGSVSHIRALVARAILSEPDRSADIASAIQVLAPQEPTDGTDSVSPSTLLNVATPITSLPDLNVALCCITAVAHLDMSPSLAHPKAAYAIINTIRPTQLGLLGFAAALKLMEALVQHEEAASQCRRALENLAGSLRIWVGGRGGLESELSRETKVKIVERCLAVTKQCVGMEADAGYETMSDREAAKEC